MTPTADTRAFGQWLCDVALPFWVSNAAQPDRFVEQFDHAGQAIDLPRRTRLTGRQIYVFATAARLGWITDDALARRGMDMLLGLHVNPQGLVHAALTPDAQVLRADFDLYDHAFALFGLASAAPVDPRAAPAARAMLTAMEVHRHPVAGYIDGPNATGQDANAHMHMFESALAWEVIDDDPRWAALADTLAALCRQRLRHPETGALHEHFDDTWAMLPDEKGGIVEPGHNFEWAWLMAQWAGRRGDPHARRVAEQMYRIAQSHGIASNEMTLNALDRHLNPTDRNHRLWPETERIKAALVFGDAAAVDAGTRALMAHFTTDLPGLWHETLLPDGTPEPAPVRASSLYHILGAAVSLQAAGAL